MTVAERYAQMCQTPSAINEHMPLLRQYASQCQSVLELGVHTGCSTTAFLASGVRTLVSMDLVASPDIFTDLGLDMPHAVYTTYGISATTWDFWLMDSCHPAQIPEPDLLFIDSAHYYDQVAKELSIYAPKTKRWIILHDTISYGRVGEGDKPGILHAIDNFLAFEGAWSPREHLLNNNGLMILERT